jgi:hypothetical protein
LKTPTCVLMGLLREKCITLSRVIILIGRDGDKREERYTEMSQRRIFLFSKDKLEFPLQIRSGEQINLHQVLPFNLSLIMF